jgi:hypothetical protein
LPSPRGAACRRTSPRRPPSRTWLAARPHWLSAVACASFSRNSWRRLWLWAYVASHTSTTTSAGTVKLERPWVSCSRRKNFSARTPCHVVCRTRAAAFRSVPFIFSARYCYFSGPACVLRLLTGPAQ